jgi:hypothetical protein
MPQRIDVTGRAFGRATVVSDAERSASGRRRVLCSCDCGTQFVCDPRSLLNGGTTSCGCLHREVVKQLCVARSTHRMTRTPEYNSWVKMRDRCENHRSAKFSDYGARGIVVCPIWDGSFEAFYSDMGPKPKPSWSLDRIDVDGPYAPENCRWASPKQQSRNKRNHRLVKYNGQDMPLSEACERSGTNYRSALWRLNTGKLWQPSPRPSPNEIER